jgi:hypothetical protein
MKLGPASKDGVIYQITDDIDGVDVVIDITYSAGEGENELEFEYSQAEAKANPKLDEEELRVVNKILECGMEEKYVKCLVDYYRGTDIVFLPNHYEF